MTNNTFKIDGTHYEGCDTFQVDVRSDYFDTEEEALAVFATIKFPKYANVKVSPIYGAIAWNGQAKYTINGNAIFRAVQGNDKNEAGERRIRAMAKALKGTPQIRPAINWKSPLTNEELNSFGFEL